MRALLQLTTDGAIFEQGVLTNWSAEARLLKQFHGDPNDCYDLQVANVHVCADPIPIFHKKVRGVGSGGIGSISRTQPLFIAHWGAGGVGGDAGSVQLQVADGVMTASDLLQKLLPCRGVARVAAEDVPTIIMPVPVAFLLQRGAWSSILLRVRWHKALRQHRRRRPLGPIPHWPPGDALLWCVGAAPAAPSQEDEAPVEPLTAETLDRIAGIIRGWAPCLLRDEAEPVQLPGSAREDMQAVLTMLDRWSFSWRQALGMVSIPGGGSRFRHAFHKLLDCIRLSTFLTGGPSSLVDALAQALSTALPEFLRAPFIQNITKPGSEAYKILPSASLVQRYEIALDAALMILSRDHASESSVRYAWADSSPLAGYDWIWSQHHQIEKAQVFRAFRAVCSLQEAIANFVSEHERELELDMEDDAPADHEGRWPTAPLPAWVDFLSVLKDNIREHVNPPAAMGSGHRSLVDKVACEVYKWHLQLPVSADLSAHASSYVAFCSDMGVELSIPDFQVNDSIAGLLPDWLKRGLRDVDEDAHADVLPVPVPPMPAEAAQLAMPDGPHVAEDVDIDGPCLSDSDVCAEPGEFPGPQPQPVQDFFLPDADVHQAMVHWDTFHSQLKAVEALLRVDERRQRFVWTCLQATQLEALAFRFQRFKGSLYECPWHEVINVLKQIKPLLSILARAWDAAKYVRGVNMDGSLRPAQAQAERAQNERQGLAAFDPDSITRAVQSSLFHCFVQMSLMLEEIPEKLASSAEACPCHRALFKHLSDHRRRKALAEHYGPGVTVCPVAGKMLPELIAGELESTFDTICSLQESELHLLSVRGLDPLTSAEWNTLLLTDYRNGPLIHMADAFRWYVVAHSVVSP